MCSIWWNENWQGRPKYSEKPIQVSHCSTEIPHDLTWDRTWAAAVRNWRLYVDMMGEIRNDV
jgi:hypothetical protein